MIRSAWPARARVRQRRQSPRLIAVYVIANQLSKSAPQPKTDDMLGEGEDEQAVATAPRALVLIAEDEATIAEALALIVEDAGYTALVARNGREALALTRQHQPRLILTDLLMPYLTGAELIATVRADAASDGLTPPPIIVVTAAHPTQAAAAGGDVVIMKPFDVAQVEAALQRLLPGEQDDPQ